MDERAPAVLTWYRVYAALMGLMYLGVVVTGVLLPMFVPLGHDDPPRWFFWLVFTGLGLPFAAVFIAALFLPPRPWVWVYHLVLISVGLTSVCCMVASVPLLIFWIKPETKRYFGRR